MNLTVSQRALAALGLVTVAVITAGCRGGDVTDAPVVGPDSALQVAFGARLTLTDSGVARATLVADSALIYDEGLRMDLRRVRLAFVDTAGDSVGYLSAARASYDIRTSVLEATGEVSVTGTNGRALQTSHASYNPITNILRSDSSYTLKQGGSQSSGQGFESSPSLVQVGRPTTRR